MKFDRSGKLTLITLFLICISTTMLSFSHHIDSFKSAYIYGNLYQQIKFACSENLFERYANVTVSEYDGIKSQDGSKAYIYSEKVIYNEHDYVISYINSDEKGYSTNLYAFIESDFGDANLTVYFYYDYYSVRVLYECEDYSFSTRFNTNLDFNTDNLSLEDAENYKKTLKVISESTIKETIEVFYNQANNDMNTIYNLVK